MTRFVNDEELHEARAPEVHHDRFETNVRKDHADIGRLARDVGRPVRPGSEWEVRSRGPARDESRRFPGGAPETASRIAGSLESGTTGMRGPGCPSPRLESKRT